ncbi:MAG: host attachment protein, partial [Alloalcanivorax venustensis]
QATSDKHAAFFAKEVAEYMKHNLEQGRADRFILVAEPRFLGALRDKLDPTTRDAVSREIDKDLTKQSADDIRKKLDL